MEIPVIDVHSIFVTVLSGMLKSSVLNVNLFLRNLLFACSVESYVLQAGNPVAGLGSGLRYYHTLFFL